MEETVRIWVTFGTLTVDAILVVYAIASDRPNGTINLVSQSVLLSELRS